MDPTHALFADSLRSVRLYEHLREPMRQWVDLMLGSSVGLVGVVVVELTAQSGRRDQELQGLAEQLHDKGEALRSALLGELSVPEELCEEVCVFFSANELFHDVTTTTTFQADQGSRGQVGDSRAHALPRFLFFSFRFSFHRKTFREDGTTVAGAVAAATGPSLADVWGTLGGRLNNLCEAVERLAGPSQRDVLQEVQQTRVTVLAAIADGGGFAASFSLLFSVGAGLTRCCGRARPARRCGRNRDGLVDSPEPGGCSDTFAPSARRGFFVDSLFNLASCLTPSPPVRRDLWIQAM